MKMPTTTGIFISTAEKISFWTELNMKKSFVTSGPGISEMKVTQEQYN